MEIIYLGKDIYPDVAVNRCWYDSYCEGRADELVIRFNDATAVWDRWKPENGGVIEVRDEKVRTGVMHIYSFQPENGLYTLRARSCPASAYENRTKSYDNVRLFDLAGEIAGRHGLRFENYAAQNHLYDYIEQRNINDLELLNFRCMLEGYSLIVVDNKLIIYDQMTMESQQPSDVLAVGKGDDFIYRDDNTEYFGSCVLTNGGRTGRFAAGTGRELSKRCSLYAADDGEMSRYARGILRRYDKDTAVCTLDGGQLYDGYAAGSVVRLETTGAESWDGTCFITHIRHDLVFMLSRIEMRKPLGW